jgi:hypothetical protein
VKRLNELKRGGKFRTREDLVDERQADIDDPTSEVADPYPTIHTRGQQRAVQDQAEIELESCIDWLTYLLGDSHKAVHYIVDSMPPFMSPILRRDPMPQTKRKKVFERDAYRCRRCSDWHNLEVDHIIPVSKGGGNGMGNLQTLCNSCNSKKADKLEASA